jgi:uncharacterized protein
MSIVYLDSSVLLRAYLVEEPGHADAQTLLTGTDALVTARWTLVEATSALTRAHRARRIVDLQTALAVLAADTGPDGAVTLLTAPSTAVESEAMRLCRTHGLRSLDALHLAVALLAASPLTEPSDPLSFASRDDAQAAAALTEGLRLR